MLVAASLVGAVGFGFYWNAGPPPPAPVSVVLYVVDTLRADRLGVYGNGRGLTPRLDALARESVLFAQAYAAGPWTLPSVASLLTSTWPCEHGVVRYGKKLSPRLPTLAEQLAGVGYTTGAYYNNYWVGGVAGVDRGFQQSVQKQDGENSRAGDTAGFLNRAGPRPFLLYLHSIEPHHPFNTPEAVIDRVGGVAPEAKALVRALFYRYREIRTLDFAEGRPPGTTDTSAEQSRIMAELTLLKPTVLTLYDAGVNQADTHVGEVVDLLKSRGLWDRTLFIVLSDHGEEFGEHGGWFHDQSVYQELMHVPLLVHLPGGADGGTRVETRVSLVDLVPSVLEALGQPACAHCRGTSFLPLLKKRGANPPPTPDRPPPVNGLRLNEDAWYGPLEAARGNVNVAVRQGPLKGIWNPVPGRMELYNLTTDPGEHNDLAATQPGPAGELRDAAVGWLEACKASPRGAEDMTEPDARTKAQLRTLGYFN